VIISSLIAVPLVLIIVVGAVAYIRRRKKYEELREDWEEKY
jgi:septation ring formation regulator EzrA